MLTSLKNIPIQRKIMNVVLMSCAVVVFLMCTAYIIFEFFTFRDAMKSQVSTLSAVVASNSTSSLAFVNPEDATEVLSAFKEEKHIVAAALYDFDGTLFAKYPANIPNSALPVSPGKEGFKFGVSYLEGYQLVKQDRDKLGTLYIKSDLSAMYVQLKRFAIVAILLFAFSMIVAYLISMVLQKSISKPILALEHTARSISEERDYSVRAKKSGQDEVGALTDAFNHMLTRIESQNQEITALNQNLEQKVNERTRDLEQANETLRQQKEFVETIINSSIDIVGVFDTQLNYVMLNKRADEFYNFKQEDILGRNLLDVYPQMKDSEMVRDLTVALGGDTVTNSKYKSPLLNRYFENYYIPLKNTYGDVYGVLSIAHDITSIMESHEKLATVNTELLKSNRDLEQFAYIASHDLQEPLRKIQVFTQLMGESFGDIESMRKYQEKINQSASRMQELIQDVLDFSRISRTEDAFLLTDLNQVINSLKNDFELKIQETGAMINFEKLPVIEGIPLQLSQLFSNLISNSLKYIDKKPVIHITSKILSPAEIAAIPKLSITKSYVQIRFADNGIGFEPKYNEQIFTIFQRLHGRQAYSGTGIGLALCRKIAENHGGIITAEGNSGRGAVFIITLPVKHIA